MSKSFFCALTLSSALQLNALSDEPAIPISAQQQKQMAEFYHSKYVLITGGCGFIGSHIAQMLVECGAHVTIIDNLSTGDLNNIAPFKDQVHFVHGDITDRDVIQKVTEGQDVIFHLAAFLSVPGSVKDPSLCHRTNIDGTFNLLEAARQNGVKRFVFSSSCAVYGEHNCALQENLACKPISPYGFSKLQGELYCKQYSCVFDLETVVLRYFNVYGPRQSSSGPYAAAVSKFTELMTENKQITIFGDGSQTRDFVPVKQVAQANLLVGMLAKELVDGSIFNIGSGKSISVMELAQSLKNKFPNYPYEPAFAAPRPGDVLHVSADCQKYKELCE